MISQPADFDQVNNYQFESKLKLNESNEVDYDDGLGDDDDDGDNMGDNNVCIHDVSGSDGLESEENDEIFADVDMDSDTDLHENSPLTYVVDEMGERKKILKSTLVWSLTQSNVL